MQSWYLNQGDHAKSPRSGVAVDKTESWGNTAMRTQVEEEKPAKEFEMKSPMKQEEKQDFVGP